MSKDKKIPKTECEVVDIADDLETFNCVKKSQERSRQSVDPGF